MFCLSFRTCCTRYRPLSCSSLPLLYVPAWVSSALGQIVGARGYCAWHCSASPPHPQTPSPVLVSLWMSRRKNPPPAFDRAAPGEESCIPTALGSLGFHTYTAHRHTKVCCSQPTAGRELYIHIEISVHIEISMAIPEEQPQDGFSCIYKHLGDSASLPALPPFVTKTHSHLCAPPCRCTLSKQSTV